MFGIKDFRLLPSGAGPQIRRGEAGGRVADGVRSVHRPLVLTAAVLVWVFCTVAIRELLHLRTPRPCTSLVNFKPFLVSIYHLFLSILLYIENNWMPFQIGGKFDFLVDYKVFRCRGDYLVGEESDLDAIEYLKPLSINKYIILIRWQKCGKKGRESLA